MFYYENKHGSRVFFDDLGPPWPKHPCTDNSSRRIPALPKSDKLPTRRPLGLMQELVTNANIVGVLRGKIFGRRVPSDWTLLIINSVERRGEENIAVAEYLDSLKGEIVQFTCFSSDPVFLPGNFISQKGKEFSFLNPEWLVPIQFISGSRIARPKEEVRLSGKLVPRTPVAKAKIDRSPASIGPRDRQSIALKKSDRRHYQSTKVSKEVFCAGLLPVVKRLAREGIRKPRDVAKRLNREKVTTACGASWTPNLAHALLAYLFESQTEKAKPTSPQSLKGRHKESKGSASKKGDSAYPTAGETLSGENPLPIPKSSSVVSKAGRLVKTRPRKTETSTVKQSFSHGRTKLVTVEKRRSLGVPRTRG